MRRTTVVALGLALCLLCSLGFAATINVPADYTTVQGAIDAATAGDTINVAAGTYAENLSIAKSLTLTGPQAGVAGKGRTGSEAVISPASGNAIVVGANNVTINGFKITVPGSSIGIYATRTGGVSGLNVCDNIIAGGGMCVSMFQASSYQIQGNDLASIQPIYQNAGGGATASGAIRDNDISAALGGENGVGININCVPTKELTGLTIESNRLTYAQIALFCVINATIRSNTVQGPMGPNSGIYIGGSCQNVTVESNSVATSTASGNSCIRITTWYSYNSDVAIRDNQLSDASYGVKVTGGALASADELTFSGANAIFSNATSDTVGLWLEGIGAGSDLSIGSLRFGNNLGEYIHLGDGWTVDVDATGATFAGSPGDADIEAKVTHDIDTAGLGHVDWGQGDRSTQLAVDDVSGSVGQTVQLTAKLTADGNALAGQSVSFTVDSAAAGSGTTDAGGLATVSYPITAAGTKEIAAAFSAASGYEAANDTGTLTAAAAAPTALTLTLTPASIASGATTTCTVLGNNGVDYTAACTYYVQYGAGGSWADNVYTSAKAGAWTVTAVYNTLSDTESLTVTHGTATSVTLTPDAATINADGSQTYTVSATDAAGNPWTPAASCLAGNGAGSFTDYTYSAAAGDAGNAVAVTATVDGQVGNATLNVNAASGPGTTLAWDKDTRKFYLCSNATDPETGTEITGSGTFNGVACTVSGGSTNVTVTAGGASLRATWYLRGGALYRVCQYSTGTASGSQAATYYASRTLLGGTWQTGYWGLTHTITGGVATYGSAQQ